MVRMVFERRADTNLRGPYLFFPRRWNPESRFLKKKIYKNLLTDSDLFDSIDLILFRKLEK